MSDADYKAHAISVLEEQLEDALNRAWTAGLTDDLIAPVIQAKLIRHYFTARILPHPDPTRRNS